MLSLLYSQFSPDAITQSALRVSEHARNMQALCVEEGIQQGKWHMDAAGRFTLSLPEALQGPFRNGSYLLNRAFIYDESLQVSTEFPLKVVQLETECAFRRLIDSAEQASARTGLYALCGDYLPLYLQWKRVQTLDLPIVTPRYDYAFGNLPPATDGFANTIYKSPFDLRSWKPNEPPQRDWHTFVVERPAGVPVVATVINNTVLLNKALEQDSEQLLHTASRLISQLFGTAFGEVLFFADDDKLTFAAFSHVTSQTIDASIMDEIMQQELVSLEEI